VFYQALYTGGLMNEVTTFAAFTALLVFLPAVIAVAIGRWLVDRKAPAIDRKAGVDDGERADTDVFAACSRRRLHQCWPGCRRAVGEPGGRSADARPSPPPSATRRRLRRDHADRGQPEGEHKAARTARSAIRWPSTE